jgi:hypothetical protein
MKTTTLFKLLLLPLLFISCSSNIPTSSLQDKTFPEVSAKLLDGKSITLPSHFIGKPVILLIAYQQKTQFDVDRWALGLTQAEVGGALLEVPTISGFVPTLLSEVINNGMKSGIPNEDWGAVATVYEDSDKIQSVIGNENPQNTQVVVLDKTGKIVWFHNRGYSPRLALELKALMAKLLMN